MQTNVTLTYDNFLVLLKQTNFIICSSSTIMNKIKTDSPQMNETSPFLGG